MPKGGNVVVQHIVCQTQPTEGRPGPSVCNDDDDDDDYDGDDDDYDDDDEDEDDDDGPSIGVILKNRFQLE